MAKYTSKPVVIERSNTELASKFSNFLILQDNLNSLDAEERAKVGNVTFTEDTIEIQTPQIGAIVLRAVERTPEHIVLEAENAPVAMKLLVGFKPLSENSTEVSGAIDVDIPVMLRPLLGSTLQKAADQFGNMFARLA